MMVNFDKNNMLAHVDHYSEYVPFISYITLFVNAIQNKYIIPKMEYDEVSENKYFNQISSKSKTRKLILLVPIFGNIIVAIVDIRLKSRADQNTQTEGPTPQEQMALPTPQEETAPSMPQNQMRPSTTREIFDQQMEAYENFFKKQDGDNDVDLVDPDPEDYGLTLEDLEEADNSSDSGIVQDQMELYEEYSTTKAFEELLVQESYVDPDPEDYPLSLDDIYNTK